MNMFINHQKTCVLFNKVFAGVILSSLLFGSCAHAEGGVALGATRVIYPQDASQVSLPINNSDNKNPFLIQSWVSDANGEKSTDFIVTPPLFVIQPGKENTLRIMYVGKKKLPNDRESFYYLNSKSIPSGEPTSGKNTLQIATQNIIKLFIRPKNLTVTPNAAPGMLSCKITGSTLTIKNSSPYYVTMVHLNIGALTMPNTMVAPKSLATVDIKGNIDEGSNVKFRTVNDFGATTTEQQCRN